MNQDLIFQSSQNNNPLYQTNIDKLSLYQTKSVRLIGPINLKNKICQLSMTQNGI